MSPPSASRSARAVARCVFGGALAGSVAAGAIAGLLFLLVLLPVAGLLFAASPRELWHGLGDPLAAPALRLTLATTVTSLALVIVCGTPLAWFLARRSSRLWQVIETIFHLPVVMPPAVAGVALLATFGRRGLLGSSLAALGIGLPFTGAAVVIAQVFVAAPFYVQAATAAFRRLDPNLILVARTLGASWTRVFLTVVIPMSRNGLSGGAALTWARALGEFGATLMFAGNMTGRTQTLPLAIYTALESDLRTAQSLSVVLLLVAFSVLVAVRVGTRS